jgi:hypothetical protein
MRRLLLLTLLALSCAGIALGLTGSPASAACDPRPGPLAGDLKQADVVFTGTVSSVQKGAAGAPTTYVVAVERTYHGRVESEVTVLTPATAKECGLQDVKAGQRWLFAGTSSPTGVLVESDEGSRPLTAAVTRQVRQVLGVGRAPIPVDPSTEPLDPELTRVADDDATTFWPLAAPGALVSVAGLVVLAAARALGRPKDAAA